MIASATHTNATNGSAEAAAIAASAASAMIVGRGEAFPVMYSGLSTQALVETILPVYDLGEPVRCRLLNRGLTDTYEVKLAPAGLPEATDGAWHDRVILRAYRAGWRTDADVLYEVDALNHLRRKGALVAWPIAARDGSYVRAVMAPEGRRQVVLFRFAPGSEQFDRQEHAVRYGRAVAEIHAATDDFATPHERFHIDLVELLDRPLAAIAPFLEHRPDDWQYFLDLAGKLRAKVQALPADALETGFCHGDLHGGNVSLDGETLTFFDFDCCGPGWRAYDVAVFLWGGALGGLHKPRTRVGWPRFLAGYRERRPLAGAYVEAIPLFVAIRHLWLLGLHTSNSRDWGAGWLHDRYFDRAIKFLKEWETRRVDRPAPRTWHAVPRN